MRSGPSQESDVARDARTIEKWGEGEVGVEGDGGGGERVGTSGVSEGKQQRGESRGEFGELRLHRKRELPTAACPPRRREIVHMFMFICKRSLILSKT